MAVTLTGTDGLFTRLGKIFVMVDDSNSHQSGGAASIDTQMVDIFDEYSSDDQDMIAALADQTRNFQGQAGGPTITLSQAAENTVIEMVNDDSPLLNKTIQLALEELISQMELNSDSVDGESPGVGALGTGTGNTGDGEPIMRQDTFAGTTVQNQNLRPETLTITCTRDAQNSGTAGRETFTVTGENRVSDTRLYDWPGGSGVSMSLRVSDPAENGQRGVGRNLMTNSAFETFTVADTPDNWIINTGAAATDIVEEGTIVYRGSKSVAFVGDGATLVSMQQAFDTSGQTAGQLKPKTRYACYYRIQVDASTVAGVLRISVKDGSNNILDSGGAAESSTLSGVSVGTFDQGGFYFSTDASVPATTKCVIEYTTAQTSAKKCYIDELMIIEMPQLAGGGPYLFIVPGPEPFVIDDVFSYVVQNTYTGEFAKHFDRSFGMYGRGLQLPYDDAGGETVPDSLIS